MHHLKYIVYQEGEYYVSQCLNMDIASFGSTIDEAIANLIEAVELYLMDEQGQSAYLDIGNALIGEAVVNA